MQKAHHETHIQFEKIWKKFVCQASSNRSKPWKFDWFDDVWYALFVNFERKVFNIFLKSIGNKISDFKWIQNRPPNRIFLYTIPSRKLNIIFVSKLTKNCIPNIIKSIKNHENWLIWWCLVCGFLSISKQKFCLVSSRVLTTKYHILTESKIDPQKAFFYTPYPWGK